MGDDDRVVLRSGLTGPVVSVAVSLLMVAAVSWALGDWFALWAVAGVIIGSLLSHLLRRVVFTSRGLEVWSFGYTFVARSQVADVSVGGSWRTERYVAVRVMPDGTVKKLAAPRATLGIGDRDVEAARDLVEQWWLRHRGDVVVPTQPTPVPGHDPWAPPPV
jgi:hypothetical protein